ncbi:hypothetical protein [Microbacterium amylolyticum]|uniref:H+/gluconate symporter-like permease n=1 Tax=Microbacterium amylolyticum TaxID=936337 RepID=A0ABS4ZJK1_9MICO|nr:hypothetical protein [Microbacterium amylolyticum]MBP2436651.1 H+/gluconate symporter-like permease [Microbacterium amylolyticum]
MIPEVAQKYADADAVDLSAVERAQAESDRTTTTRTIRKPHAVTVISLILRPILMIAAGTIGDILVEPETTASKVLSFIGAPTFALLVATILAMYLLGIRHGWGKHDLSDLMDAALAPAAIVVFVTGAGGVFARVLTESGIGDAVSGLLTNAGVPIVILAFLIALSHINDSGFWIATKFLGLSVGGGRKTWTVMCTVAGFLGMALITIAWFVNAAVS